MANNETPTLAQVIRDAIEARLLDVHTAMPATIVSYDAAKQKASVQPVLQKKYASGKVVTLPVITNVPVVMPRANKAFISLPLKAGDHVLLIFSERSIDRWAQKGGVTDPNDPRKFSLSDAFAIPGGYPFSDVVAGSATDLIIENDNAQIQLKPSGKFKVNKKGGDELFDLLSQTLQAILDARTMTAFGPQPFLNLSTFAQLKAKIDALKG